VRQAVVLLVVALHTGVVRVVILQPEGHETGLSELGKWPRIWAPRGAQGRIQWMLRAAQGCSGLLRLGTVLHSHSSGLLIHRLCYSHMCSGLEVEMEFGEVNIEVIGYNMFF
jgi:hypothetical protein